jgi:hypothetical protein
MSKKDYEFVAGAVGQFICSDGSGEDVVDGQVALRIAHELCDLFLDRYPNFDPDKFLAAANANYGYRPRRKR